MKMMSVREPSKQEVYQRVQPGETESVWLHGLKASEHT